MMLRVLVLTLDEGHTLDKDRLKECLQFAARALELAQTRLPPADEVEVTEFEELSRPGNVPVEVQQWLASTFTRRFSKSHSKKRRRFRSVATAICAGLAVERIFRRLSASYFPSFPEEVEAFLKGVNEWEFDVFEFHRLSEGFPLRYMAYELLNRYGILHRFKARHGAKCPRVSFKDLECFVKRLEAGYGLHKNPYHNNTHATDVTQTVHSILCQSSLATWLSHLEIFALLFAAMCHDYEHTGTTNDFHVITRSEVAYLYNDKSVLENYHLSQTFKLVSQRECNILGGLNSEEYREFRTLVIDAVLATDMATHFEQIATVRRQLVRPEFESDHESAIYKDQWRDRETELGLPASPLCDRHSTHVPDSQIGLRPFLLPRSGSLPRFLFLHPTPVGFIDFIVSPTLTLVTQLLDSIDKVLEPLTAGASMELSGPTSVKKKLSDIPENHAKNTSNSIYFMRPICLVQRKRSMHPREEIKMGDLGENT
ncbi:unnamed protein product [Darwinula stevensoni]|uniref:Phosphodiesterase n=1 Tax=Darwinula stevensoni TaxID=69355 RepID=A0A7R9A3Q7_9CRUS|nr:unnamed protein product [Darwinula stevensoni]CAG0892095.1 unnamed protein product [Darwinula stevensoni]